MPNTTIAVATALSPSSTTLAEYGWHLLRALALKQGIKVVALVEDADHDYPEIEGVEIVKCWRFDALTNAWRIARAARRVGADAVLFNAHFTSFGSSKAAAALGLMSPLVARTMGMQTVTLLHNIVETVDLAAAGFGRNRLVAGALRAVGSVVTWLVLRSHLVTTTMPRYVELLRAKYRAKNVVLTPHGAFDVPAPPVEPEHPERIMTFGKFGTYKKVETLIEAVRLLGRNGVELVVAGTDSPNTPGYLAAVNERLGGPDVTFTGYLPEEDVEPLFRSSAVTVFPYTATTGSSGVLHQAGSFGCAPVLPRIGDLEDLIEDEGYTGAFFAPDDAADLARSLREVLDNEVERNRIAQHNYQAACALTLEDVADWYLAHLGRLVHGEPRRLLTQAPVEAAS